MKPPYNIGPHNFVQFKKLINTLVAMKYDITVDEVKRTHSDPPRYTSLTPKNAAEKSDLELFIWRKMLQVIEVDERYLCRENLVSRVVMFYQIANTTPNTGFLFQRSDDLVLNLLPLDEPVDLSEIPDEMPDLSSPSLEELLEDDDDEEQPEVVVTAGMITDNGDIVPMSMQNAPPEILAFINKFLFPAKVPSCHCDSCRAKKLMHEIASVSRPVPMDFNPGLN